MNKLFEAVNGIDINKVINDSQKLSEEIQKGHKVSVNGVDGPEFEKIVYKDYYVLLNNPSTGRTFMCEEFDDESAANDWATRQVKYNGFDASVYRTEDDDLLNYYDSDDFGKYESDDADFYMKDLDNGKVVRVSKSHYDDKWHDSDGNNYMGYLSKQDIKTYFKGNWREVDGYNESQPLGTPDFGADFESEDLTEGDTVILDDNLEGQINELIHRIEDLQDTIKHTVSDEIISINARIEELNEILYHEIDEIDTEDKLYFNTTDVIKDLKYAIKESDWAKEDKEADSE